MGSTLSADLSLYKRLLSHVIPHWKVFMLSIVSMIVLAATDPAIPALMQPMLDGAFIEKDPKTIAIVPFLFVGLFFLRGISSYIGNSALQWVSSKVIMDLRQAMFDRMIEYPAFYHDQNRSGEIVSRFTFDVTQIKEASTNAISTLVRDSLSVIGLLAWMYYIDWLLATICLVGAPLIATIISIIRKRLRKMSRRVQDAMGDITHTLNEVLDAQKIVKLYGGQDSEKQRFHKINNSHRLFSNKFAMAANASSPSIQMVTAIMLALIVYIATKLANADSLSVGDFVSFFTAMAMLLGPLKRLAGVNEHIQKGLAACESVFNILDAEVENDTGELHLENPEGRIEFKSVNFRYPASEKYALNDISFTIEPGETVALVGESGSGKTTLVSMLPRFYEPVSGYIRYDGNDIRELSLTSLRRHIAFVSQDVVLFNDTVRNNIAYGDLYDASDEAIYDAASAAHASEFIESLPDKMSTLIGEHGTRLSGGQRQRLAIARALLKDARLLIMDEATSSLDTRSERHIQSAMENVKKGRTCLIIAHRLSTIENADRIIVLDKGKIVEQGQHQSLLELNQYYARLYQVQFSDNFSA